MRHIRKVLVANRGEIAIRVFRACSELGIRTVAIYSKEDILSLHRNRADEAYLVGEGDKPVDAYLDIEDIIRICKEHDVDAIHPGYGFLAENAKLAKRCEEEGIIFIGPRVEHLMMFGDKVNSRIQAEKADIPMIPGSKGAVKSFEEVKEFAEKNGFPIMIKAVNGGGGRGIRRVDGPEELEHAFLSATAEAQSAFGDGAVYMEKLLENVKHVEVQLLCDAHGNAVTLGERECSMQRKHQKLIEESPSPAVSRSQRKKLMDQVTKAVKAIGYVGVGTLEFLLDRDGRFWFMEMNLRLQVEHGVTEMLTKIDLVKWQIRVAAGVPLNFRQQDVSLSGACLECRINATRPGTLTMLHVPGGPFVRFDTYLVAGTTVSPYYDSLLGKLIVYAGTREEALRKMKAALCELMVEGIETNIAEQLDLVSRPDFMDGSYDLTFLEGE